MRRLVSRCLLSLVMSVALSAPVEAMRQNGTVKWFDTKKGFGFITTEGGEDVLVTSAILARSTGTKCLDPGSQVEFEIRGGPKGLEAHNVTGGSDAICSATLPPPSPATPPAAERPVVPSPPPPSLPPAAAPEQDAVEPAEVDQPQEGPTAEASEPEQPADGADESAEAPEDAEPPPDADEGAQEDSPAEPPDEDVEPPPVE